MLKNLEKKVKNFFVGVGLIGSLVFPTGCEMTPQGQALFQGLGTQMVYSFIDEAVRQEMNPQMSQQYNSPVIEIPENVIREGGRIRPAPGYTWVNPNDNDDKRVVRILENTIRDGNKINPAPGYDWINPNDPNDFRVRPLENIIREEDNFILFTYDKYEDKNGDGVKNYPQEFGIKNIFKKGETIHLSGVFVKYQKGDRKQIGLYFPNGENKLNIININEDSNFVETEFDGGLEIGRYKSILYLNDKAVKSHEFEIRE